MAARPETGTMVMMSLFSYAQVRCLYDVGHYWEPETADAVPKVAPAAAAVPPPAPALTVAS